MKRNLVTGGSGFLGSHLSKKLLERGEEVICIDNFFTGTKKNIEPLMNHPCFELIRHDVTESIKIEVDKIWHLACPASPHIYQNDPLKTIRVNYEGTLNVLNLAKDHNSKILFTSSSEIYGETKNNPQYEKMPITLSTFSPRACYSEGKRIAETLINSFSKSSNLDVKIARVFNTYGPRLDFNDGRVIGNFIKQCSINEKLTIYGDGSQTRSFCYVSDLVEGLIKLMNSNYCYPINLGNDQEISILELANLIKSKFNSRLNFKFCDLPSDDPECRKPSLEKSRNVLKWDPKISLSEGLNKTIRSYLEII